MRDYLFSYDDICLRPKYSELKSRSYASTSKSFLFQIFSLPVIPANMQDVISWDLAFEIEKYGYYYIMHRFENSNRDLIRRVKDGKCPRKLMDKVFVNISLGVNEFSKQEYDDLLKADIFPSTITIDVAHGHHKKVENMIKWLRKNRCQRDSNGSFIIAGNVATADGYKFLCDLGADAVKVGIGGGSICTTRYKTGFHIPTAYSVWDCATNGNRNVPIIADGGLKHYGDIAKALVLGADMVMSGRWFAECLDSPAGIAHGKKIYRGSTSFESKGYKNHIEGQTIEISEGVSYFERFEEIKQALQSSISYAGGIDLSAFKNVEWNLCK